LTLCAVPLPVLRRAGFSAAALTAIVAPYGARLVEVSPGARLPGSYWGAPEAGLAANRLYVRGDTPMHSLLHELGHYVCMTPTRRARLWLDAGGDDDEECAVCYLQLVLADHVPGFGGARCCDDMDAWGYSFREGSALTWRDGDGADARRWLLERGLIDATNRPTWRLR
jgi:hypothetical protein